MGFVGRAIVFTRSVDDLIFSVLMLMDFFKKIRVRIKRSATATTTTCVGCSSSSSGGSFVVRELPNAHRNRVLCTTTTTTGT
jgi:hypothetical protein